MAGFRARVKGGSRLAVAGSCGVVLTSFIGGAAGADGMATAKPPTTVTVSYNVTGSTDYVVVPAGVSSMVVATSGASGAPGCCSDVSLDPSKGGNGELVVTT